MRFSAPKCLNLSQRDFPSAFYYKEGGFEGSHQPIRMPERFCPCKIPLMKKNLSWLILFPFLILLSLGCATGPHLRVPVRPSPQHTLNPPPPARLRIPVVINLPNLSEVEKHLADFAKEDFKKTEKSLTKSLGTTVWWDPLDWEFNGNTLTAHMHIHYKKKQGSLNADVKEAEKIAEEVEQDAKVDLASTLQWNKDWHLEAPNFDEAPEAGGNTLEPEESDSKKSERLLRKGTAGFHESLKRSTNIKDQAAEIWKQLQEPIRMASDIWLQIKTDKVSVGSYRLIPDPKTPRLETVFEVYAQPSVIIGQEPSVIKSELPPLSDYQPGPEGFHIETNLKISFHEVNKLLIDPKTGILNKALPGSGNHHLKITNISVYGSGGQIVVEAQVDYDPLLDLSGHQAQLTIYLVGTPKYHEDTQLIDFPDIDFDIQTSDFLVQMAEFIAGSGIRDALRKQAVVPVGKNLDELKDQLTKLLNRPLGPFARLHTTITSLKMEEAFVSDYGLEGRVALDGDAAVDLNL